MIVERLVDAVIAEQQEREHNLKIRIPGRFWPSEAASCGRRIYYAFIEPMGAEPPTVEQLFNFQAGKLYEGQYLDYLNARGVLAERDVPIVTETNAITISGRADGVIAEAKDYYPLEVKSVKEYAMKKILNEGPMEHHVCQCLSYVHGLSAEKGYLLVIDRSGKYMPVEFEIKRDTNKFNGFIDKFILIDQMIREHELPDREYKKSDWQCKYCPWTKLCWI